MEHVSRILQRDKMWTRLILLIFSMTIITLIDGRIPDATYVSYEQEGDFQIGGIFPLSNVGEVPCGSPPTLSTSQLTEAMVYAVNVVNNDTTLLPNVTLGFDIRDGCRSDEDSALWSALNLATKITSMKTSAKRTFRVREE